jgi:hypothetical protein
MTLRRALATAALALAIASCSRAAPDSTPDGALRLFLEKMEASNDNARAIREAYALLGPDARKSLEERARRAGQLQGKRVEPYQMLAEGRFGLRFRPKTMKPNVAGDRATIDVVGDDPKERATVRCVHEAAGWRVEPDLPEPPPPAIRDGM